MKNVLYKNGRFLIKEQNGYRFHIGDCCVHNGVILGFDMDSFSFDECFDLDGSFVIPSFFNTHVHLGESIFRCIKGMWTLEKYLDYTNAYNNNLSNLEREIKWNEGALYTIEQMINNGCSMICSARSGIAQKYGLKVLSGYPLMSSKKLETFTKEGTIGFQKFRDINKEKGVSSGLFIHSLYQIDYEHLKLSREIQKNGIDFLTIHISETENSRIMEIDKFNKRPIETLLENQLLDSKTILVHCNHLDDFELSCVAESKASIAICPISNVFLGEKPLNPNDLDKYGIEWYIATDGVATGRTFSIFKQLDCVKRLYPEVDFKSLFESVTIKPARKFMMNNYYGEIRRDSAADFAIIDYVEGIDINNFFKWLITDAPIIKDLVVNGINLSNRRLI